MTLDTDFVRSQFPAFRHPKTGRWAYFENAGGSYVPNQVIDRLQRFFVEHKVQPYGPFPTSIEAGQEMDESYATMAELINAGEDELTLGPSTTLNFYVLAQGLRHLFEPGDEIVVTNQDHEANIGCWRKLESLGVTVREWQIDGTRGELDIGKLESLVSKRTKLICFSLCSNVVGTFNDAGRISDIAHSVGALAIADGVSQAPHSVVDVRTLGVDFYAFSTYKTFGTHVGLLWGKPAALELVENQSHWFNADKPHYRLNPAGPQHAEIAALTGVAHYYDALYKHHFPKQEENRHKRARQVFGLFAEHEARLANQVLEYLSYLPGLRIIGQTRAEPHKRASTISFVVSGRSSQELAQQLAAHQVAARADHFYAMRCVKALGIDPADGVVRISIVHYNTESEVQRLIRGLEAVMSSRTSISTPLVSTSLGSEEV